MDENGKKLWIENVWKRRPRGVRKERSLLVWDMFGSHITENSKARLSRTNTDIAVKPGGLISLLQPLDVNLNKPLKEYTRKEWNNWMTHGEIPFTKGGAIRDASRDVLWEFVIKAWCDEKKEA